MEAEGSKRFAAGFRSENLSERKGDAVDGSDLMSYQYPKQDNSVASCMNCTGDLHSGELWMITLQNRMSSGFMLRQN